VHADDESARSAGWVFLAGLSASARSILCQIVSSGKPVGAAAVSVNIKPQE
jgi:hypothetical protein